MFLFQQAFTSMADMLVGAIWEQVSGKWSQLVSAWVTNHPIRIYDAMLSI